ncbi:MAG: tetratricopeptide repeat protein [Gammaproteobacteria bacterium]|nr:tetratricopeptide repeat protein [Gammaproteobacteria bacterium]
MNVKSLGKFRLLLICMLVLCITNIYAQNLDITDLKAQYNKKNYTQTLILAKQYTTQSPNDPDGWLFSGYANYQLNNYTNALSNFKTALVLAPHYADVWLALIQTYYSQKDYVRAMETSIFAETYCPNNKEILLFSAKIARAQNNINQAKEILTKLIQAYPDYADAKIALNDLNNSELPVKQPNIPLTQPIDNKVPVDVIAAIDTVHKELIELVQAYPDSETAKIALKEVENEELVLTPSTPPSTTSITQLQETETLAPAPAPTTVIASDVKLTVLDSIIQEAVSNQQLSPLSQVKNNVCIIFSINLSEKTPSTVIYKKISPAEITIPLIKNFIATNQLNEAEKNLNLYIKKHPTDTDGYFLLAKVYQIEKKFKLAYAELQQVAAINPNYPDLTMSMINLLFSMKNYAQIILLATEKLAIDPHNTDLICALAQAQYSMSDYKTAIDFLSSQPDYKQNTQILALYNQMNADTDYHYISYMKVGMNIGDIAVKNPNQAWTLSNAYAQYNTPRGTVGMAVNYQTRPSLDAAQYEVYVDPILSKTNYANMTYAHANNANLFPDQYFYAEDFQTIPWNMDISLGNTYRKLGNTSWKYCGTCRKSRRTSRMEKYF